MTNIRTGLYMSIAIRQEILALHREKQKAPFFRSGMNAVFLLFWCHRNSPIKESVYVQASSFMAG
ncbi:TPA: hypothetical protein HA241_06980 [Candidatus Woesearchaeota archaeon]|nr:hypothetical protein [Candidatus Woesearchaeota archaeon]